MLGVGVRFNLAQARGTGIVNADRPQNPLMR